MTEADDSAQNRTPVSTGTKYSCRWFRWEMISLAVRQSDTARVFSYLPASWLLLLLQQCRANSRPASAAATPGLGHQVAVRCRGRAPKTFSTLPYLQLSVTDVKGPFFQPWE